MSEKKEEVVNQAENLKKETAETVKQVKESVKDVNIKDETLKTKGFVVDMFKNPIKKISEIAKNDTNKYFKTAIWIIIIWTVAVLIKTTYSTIYYWGFVRVFSNILSVIKAIIVPALGILVYSIIALILNKEEKKPLTSIIATVTAIKLPLVVASIVSLLTLFSYEFTKIMNAINGLASVISIVLSYFAFKALFNEKKDEAFIKKFALIQVIYFVVYFVVSFLGINI